MDSAHAPAPADDLTPAPLGECSIEITSKDIPSLEQASSLLAQGTRISITALPREDNGQTVRAIETVLALGLRPVPHLSARRTQTRQALQLHLQTLARIGAAEELFIVAGDLDVPVGPFESALDVIRSGQLARHGVRRVGIGGYPEGHPKIAEAMLWKALHDKAAAVSEQGLELAIVTQFGFEPKRAVRWIQQVREAGIQAPIRLGVPGPSNAATLIRFAARCGVAASRSALRKYGLSLSRLMQTSGPDSYVKAVAHGLEDCPSGNVGLHLYPFGGLLESARWIASHRAQERPEPDA